MLCFYMLNFGKWLSREGKSFLTFKVNKIPSFSLEKSNFFFLNWLSEQKIIISATFSRLSKQRPDFLKQPLQFYIALKLKVSRVGGFEEQSDKLVLISYLYFCYFYPSGGGGHGSIVNMFV